jgi:hypothetical protein
MNDLTNALRFGDMTVFRVLLQRLALVLDQR